jgi:hypothetical protein
VPDKPELSIKQQRNVRRADKVELMKKKQRADSRKLKIGIIGTLSLVAGILALVIGVVVVPNITLAEPRVDPASIEIAGLTTFDNLTSVHVDPTPVNYSTEYGMNPPAGGNHFGAWLNCGVYSEPQQNENAVHSLEHGAVWVTYDPTILSDDDVSTLVSSLPSTYIIVSPFHGLPAPVVASAWANQIELDGISDERLGDFVDKFWKSPTAPEPGALCTGAIDGPGKLS